VVGIVVVAHSRPLARAAVALAQEMLHGQEVPVAVAAGLDETTFGTDAVAIQQAVEAVDSPDGVLVLTDLGSAVLSAEMALELMDPDLASRVTLSPAPLVEGLVVATVAAAGGAPLAEVAAEAAAALAGKQSQLEPQEAPGSPPVPQAGATGVFVVSNEHGLHARPAARLVAAARGLDATVALRNATTGSAWVPASSLSRVATLGARRGHQVEVAAEGPGAQEALDHVLALAARGFDEAPAPAVPAPARAAPPAAGPLPGAPGVAVGPVWSPKVGAVEVPDTQAVDSADEGRRLRDAVTVARRDTQRVRERTAGDLGEAEAAIFDAHLLLLEDPELLDRVHGGIEAGRTAERAWADAVRLLEDRMAGLADSYQRARAADVRGVGDQVLRALVGAAAGFESREGVLVAADLTPAEAAALDPDRVEGVVLAHSSPTAHSAILARSMGLPLVVAAGPGVLALPEGTTVALDGGTGELVVDPDPPTVEGYRARAAARRRAEAEARASADRPARTVDGVDVVVGANVGSLADAAQARSSGADVVGLVRTEFLFLDRTEAPGVEDQEAAYRALAEALGGRRVTLRTLDVGGDKPLPYLPTPAEANPFLGLRGIRLSLTRPELLRDQLVAACRVARDAPVSLMFPMVATVEELAAARSLLEEAVAATGDEWPAGLRVGAMVEVPAAALKAAAFAPYVDFFSIGTNDLTQYTLAAERGNETVARLGDPLDPAVLRLVDAVCRAAAGRADVAVCGEVAADEAAVPLLLGLGVRQLSVAPAAVPLLKQAVRRVDVAAARPLALAALEAAGPAEVRALVAAQS
jgi:phosphoenolpyruvate-protein phosphotransferase/dihydroxyacetone kinase phosphotransfer subunit